MKTKNKGTNRVVIIGSDHGVTLLETMVYLVIAGMLLGVAVTAFLGQNKSYNRQDVISEIQQNLRGAFEVMSSDIRFAGIGLNETSEEPFNPGTPNPGTTNISIALNLGADIQDDWGAALNEKMKTVHYRLNGTNLERGYTELKTTPDAVSNWETFAENIEQLRFEYLLEDTSTTPSNWGWEATPGVDELEDIRAVKIVMLGGAREAAFNPTDPSVYRPPLIGNPEWVPASGTGYKRMMSVIIQCRNNRG